MTARAFSRFATFARHAYCTTGTRVKATQLSFQWETTRHLEMRLNSYPTCDLRLLIRGITLGMGIPCEINVRIDYTDQRGTHWVADLTN